MPVEEHRAHAPRSVACGVITVSDSRTEATDESGALLKKLLTEAGHRVVFAAIGKDEPEAIAGAVDPPGRGAGAGAGGVRRGRLVFCLPGSPDACGLATKALILPELGHAVGVMRR